MYKSGYSKAFIDPENKYNNEIADYCERELGIVNGEKSRGLSV